MWLYFKPKQVERGSEREKIKIIVSFRSYPAQSSKSQKKSKKIKKYHYGIISSQHSLEKAKKERKEKLSFRLVPTGCVIENSKKIAKNSKNKKKTIMASFQAKIG